MPVLADIDWNGSQKKVILWANRNGFFYVLDRATGKFLRGNPFVKETWATGLDENGRPIRAPGMVASVAGTLMFPGIQGGTNWYSPSYSPQTGLFYVSAWQNYSAVFVKIPSASGQPAGVNPKSPLPSLARGPINTWTDDAGYGEMQAIDPLTGEKKWVFKMNDVTDTRNSHYRFGHAFDRQSGRLFFRDGCADRESAVEDEHRGPGGGFAHHV